MEEEGYIHGTVNHSLEFVYSETGDHTQNIEITWRAVKRSLPRSGTITTLYAEFMFRRQYFEDCHDRCLAFLEEAKKVYKPTLQ